MTDTITRKKLAPLNLAKFESDSLQSLYSLIQEYKEGILVKAPHQREFKWTKPKVVAWNKGIIDAVALHYGARPTGVFVTYNVPGDSTTYLNDGFQRLTASSLILMDPKYYGVPPEQAVQLLKSYNMPVQHRQFASHFEALLNFQQINFGTPLTGYEFCAGFLMDVPNSDTNWHDHIQDLHAFMGEKLSGFRGPKTNSPDSSDNRVQYGLRQNYALFCRFLTRNKTLHGGFATISTTQPSPFIVDGSKTVEQQLRLIMDSIGVDQVMDEFEVFKKFITNEIEQILGIMRSVRPELEGLLSRSVVRFLLTVAIYRRNNALPDDAWKLFIIKVFRAMSSVGHLDIYEGGVLSTRRFTLSESKITSLSLIGEIIGFDITQVERMPRTIGNATQQPGLARLIS
jgi:hypothetical protein